MILFNLASQGYEQVLVAMLVEASNWVRLYEQADDVLLFETARKNKVVSSIAHTLRQQYTPESIASRWLDWHEASHKRITAYLAELDGIATQLAKDQVPIILLENAALAKAVYPCPGCFEFGDLDLLVRKEQLPRVHQALLARGYVAVQDSDPSQSNEPGTSDSRAEYKIVLADNHSLRINVQPSLVAHRWFDHQSEPSVEELLQRSISLPNSHVRILGPEDFLFQLCVHSASHAYVRSPGISLHLDIERLVHRTPIDWQAFLKLAERFPVSTKVFFSLAIPKTLFGTPVPEPVLEALRPPAWKERLLSRWIRPAGIFNPDEPKFSRPGYILFTTLLYDDLGGLWRAIFPDRAWMKERYGFGSDLLLPYYHGCRLLDLAFRRMAT